MNPLRKLGYDDPAWGSALAQYHILEAFDIAFSCRHTRRLMHKAGVSPKRPWPEPASADEDEREEFEETVEKSRQPKGSRIRRVCVDRSDGVPLQGALRGVGRGCGCPTYEWHRALWRTSVPQRQLS